MRGLSLVGQFSYTACEAPGPYSSIPGWKVKQVLAQSPAVAVPEAVVNDAVRVFGGFRPPEIGALATQDDIDRLPRCLRLDRVGSEWRSLVHLAAAGRDRSGRDAFFAHGLLVGVTTGLDGVGPGGLSDPDRVPATLRPADLWGADGWSTPYRAEAIERATLGRVPTPSVASPADEDRLADFIDLHVEQLDVVLALAERAVTGGPTLVLMGPPVSAAMWCSLITHLLPPNVGWSLPFSTYEPVPSARTGRMFLVGAPPESAEVWDQLPPDAAVVHDPNRPVRRSGDGWVLADGSPLSAGPWAQVAASVHRLGWADEVRAGIDRLSERVGSALDDWPLFALPAAVLALPSERLEGKPEWAAMAATAAASHFPTSSMLPAELTGSLMDAVVRWGGSARRSTERILRAWEGQDPPPPAEMSDPVLVTYVRELLQPGVLDREPLPWVPVTTGVSPWARPDLITELPGLLAWLDGVESPGARAWALLAVVDLVDRLGLTTGAAGEPVRRLLIGRAREWVTLDWLRSAVATRSERPPSIPSWLWQDGLLDAFSAAVQESPGSPGELLWDPRLRTLLDGAAGPLPRVLEPGLTLRRLSPVDYERAAATLRFHTDLRLPGEARQLWQAAGFLREAMGAPGRRRRDPSRWPEQLDHWFRQDPIGAELLREVLAELPDDALGLMGLATVTLGSLPPSRVTEEIARTVVARSRSAPPITGPLAWHRQFASPVPHTSVDGANVRVSPDRPENDLLTAVARGVLPGALQSAGRDRLTRWVVVVGASAVRDWVGEDGVERPWWAAAGTDPLRSDLLARLPAVLGAVSAALVASRDQKAADRLVGEWVVRSALAQAGVGYDPLRSFFVDPVAKDGWTAVGRELLWARDRGRDAMDAWVAHVQLQADLVATARPALGDDERDFVVDAAVGAAGHLVGGGGLLGRFRRSTGQRRG